MSDGHALTHRFPTLAILLAAILCGPPRADGSSAAEAPRKRVLLLHSYHRGLTWTEGEDRGIRSELGGREDIELFTEYLDSKRFPLEVVADSFGDYLARKYVGLPFDAVLATDNSALAFLSERQAGLFPGVPVVFCGINDFEPGMLDGLDGSVTGVTQELDPDGTLRLIQSLQRDLRTLVIVSGTTPTGKAIRETVRKSLAGRHESLDVVWWDGLQTQVLLERLASLTSRDAVLLCNFNRDASGTYYSHEESAELISRASTAPVYAMEDVYLGAGVTGGSMIRSQDQGEIAARLCSAVLISGRVPELVTDCPKVVMIDAREMDRFGLDASRLPPSAVVVNRRVTFYTQHKKLIWSTCTVIFLLFLSLCGVTFGLMRAWRAEKRLRRNEENLRTTLNSIGDAVIVTDAKSRVVRMNPVAELLTGWVVEEARGRPLSEVFAVVHAMTRKAVDDPVRRVIDSGHIVGLANHTVLLAKGGAERQIADSAAPIRTERGEILGVVLVFRDVTEEYATQEALRQSEERMQLVLRCAELGTWDWNVDRDEVVVDARLAEMLGDEAGEVDRHGDSWRSRVHPDDLPRVEEALTAHLKGQTAYYEVEHRMQHSSGGWIWVLSKGRVIERDAHGRPLRACGAQLDVSERKRAEQRMIESSERLRLALQAAHMGTWEWDISQNRVAWSPETLAIFGVGPEEFGGTYEAYLAFAVPEAREQVDQGVRDFLRNFRESEEIRYEHEIVRRSGERGWIEVRGTVFLDEQGEPVRMTGICADITERKKAEEALRFTQFSIEHASVGVVCTAPDARILSANRYVCRNLGYTQEEIAQLTIMDIDPTFDRERWLEHRSRIPAGGSVTIETTHRRKDGTTFPVEVTVNKGAFEGREFAVSFVQDISERKQAEEDLKESQRALATLMSNLPGMAYRCRNDEYWTMVFVSEGSRELTGYAPSELIRNRNVNFEELIHEDHQELIRVEVERAIEARRPFELTYPIRTADGSTRWVWERGIGVFGKDGALLFLEGFIFDITERHRAQEEREILEAQLRQAQKMEAVGQLAGGVAHDFNNILTAIMGNVELSMRNIRKDLGDGHSAVSAMQEIELAAERASALTRQLLTFGRRDVTRPEVLNLDDVVRGLDSMLRRLTTEDIVLETSTDPELNAVRADAGQMEQVIVNLAVNAGHAMPDGGRLTIETRNVAIDEDYVRNHLEASPGPHVLLAVSDTGHGMDAGTMDRIFEPFFTTKDPDKGTGLGLATVHGIVKQAGGHIMVYSEPGRGTTFKVYLPAADAEPVKETTVEGAEASAGGTETLLLCEDDRLVRDLVTQTLELAGYRMITASSPVEAIAAAHAHGGAIDLLITDVIMPEMNGRTLSQRLKARLPGLKTLFVSGYTSNVIAHHGVLDEGVDFLEKPFTREQLLAAVRSVIEKPRERAQPPQEC